VEGYGRWNQRNQNVARRRWKVHNVQYRAGLPRGECLGRSRRQQQRKIARKSATFEGALSDDSVTCSERLPCPRFIPTHARSSMIIIIIVLAVRLHYCARPRVGNELLLIGHFGMCQRCGPELCSPGCCSAPTVFCKSTTTRLHHRALPRWSLSFTCFTDTTPAIVSRDNDLGSHWNIAGCHV
jgi:hypothetical protein